MLTASDQFKAALKVSHRALTRVTLMEPGPVSGFVDKYTLSISDGNLSIDGTRNVWRSGTLSVVPKESVDRDELAAIDSTYRVRIERGIRYPDGVEEWVQIGLMQVQDTTRSLKSAKVELPVADLASLVQDYPLILPYVPQDMDANRLTTVQAIQDLVQGAIVWDSIPGWDIDPLVDQTAYPTEGAVFTGSRWSAIQTLSESISAVTHVGIDGRWRIRSATADTNNPVESFDTGLGGVVSDYTRTRARAEQFNAIPLRWETPTFGGLVFIVDADPASPTYWDGPFGRKPRDEEQNDLIETSDQAIAAATALLDQYRGRTSSLRFEGVHNPLIEPLDVIQLFNGATTEIHIIDSIEYPLVGGMMSCQTRLLREVGTRALF